jgi:hypothetical protein
MKTSQRFIRLASVLVLGLVGLLTMSQKAEASEKYCDFWFWTCPLDLETFCWHRSCEPLNPYCVGAGSDRHVVCQGFE